LRTDTTTNKMHMYWEYYTNEQLDEL